MKLRPENLADFYKTGHYRMYPEGTRLIYSNLTCRSPKHFEGMPDFDGKSVFFGMQGLCQWLLIDLWQKDFFDKSLDEIVSRYKRRMDTSLGPDSVSTDHIAALHKLGYLPVLIKAVPEYDGYEVRI